MEPAPPNEGRPMRVSLGPRFPRWLAVVFGLMPAAVLAGIATMQQHAPWGWRAAAWGSAIALVGWMYYATLGSIEYDPQRRVLACGRHQVTMRPGATVVVGEFCTQDYSTCCGIRVVQPDGSSEMLYRTKILSSATLLRVRDSLQGGGLPVRMVALDELSREVEWTSKPLPPAVMAFGALGLLPWSGFLFGALLDRPQTIAFTGIAVLGLQIVAQSLLKRRVAAMEPPPGSAERQAFSFEMLSRWLFSPLYYAVAALLGWSLTHR